MTILIILLSVTLLLLEVAIYLILHMRKYIYDINITYNQKPYVLKATDTKEKKKETIMYLLAAVMRDGTLFGWRDMNMYLDEAENGDEDYEDFKEYSRSMFERGRGFGYEEAMNDLGKIDLEKMFDIK